MGEIQICQEAQKNEKTIINIYNDCILDNNKTITTNDINNQWLNK